MTAVPASSVDVLRGWRFLTPHATVLLAIAHDPDATIEEIAESNMLSRRNTFRILADLQRADYVRRTRNGRRNHYEINRSRPLADPLVEDEPVWKLVATLRARSKPPANRREALARTAARKRARGCQD